jgi:hypothetical protein
LTRRPSGHFSALTKWAEAGRADMPPFASLAPARLQILSASFDVENTFPGSGCYSRKRPHKEETISAEKPAIELISRL